MASVAENSFSNLTAPRAKMAEGRKYLYGPKIDFFLLGGFSIFLLPFLFAMPEKSFLNPLSFIMLALANIINHPHFAHSYQIFYRQFPARLSDQKLGNVAKGRYLLAGIVVPLILAGYFAIGITTQSSKLVGLAGNIMALFVGWHYVKQGYGLLMVDAAMKRNFFDSREKKILLANGYAVWTTAWLFGNYASTQRDIWGVQYYSFNFPYELAVAAAAVVSITTLLMLYLVWRRLMNGKGVPFNGVIAYLSALYLWLLFININPLWALVVPALHSIQYLAVVYRFQSNIEHEQTTPSETKNHSGIIALARSSAAFQVTLFALTGVALGIALFWKIPIWLDQNISYRHDLFGANLFLFSFWIFVNVHHYFIDNVIWRRDNADAKKYLFETPA